MTLSRSLVVIVCLLAVVALVVVSDGAGLAARRGDLQRGEYARVALLAAADIIAQQQTSGIGARLSTRPLNIDAKTGQKLTPKEVAQRAPNAKP